MGEFFRGWRRKAGLVTLAMALLLMAGWLRSYVIQDVLSINENRTLRLIVSFNGHFNSFNGHLNWERLTPSVFLPTSSMPVVRWRSFPFNNPAVWRNSRALLWTVPYWAFVLPLTLLSAWLILIKPRPAKAAKESKRA